MDILNNKVDDLKDLLIEDILDIVKIPSVKGKATNGFPFGENVAKALNKALEISEKLGFKTKNLDNYIYKLRKKLEIFNLYLDSENHLYYLRNN